ncbi:hypothetical protein ACFYZN_02610 [Streptomyces sp. NPDC001777]|uniref:hypothetical protein n=1 Tax=Streptomyces sp. NPDC001777 TaxID=3364608 RepID=UPI0036C4351F
MTTSGLPRRNPGARGRTYPPPEPRRGAPSRDLRVRAASGWERFMRRVEARQEPEE